MFSPIKFVKLCFPSHQKSAYIPPHRLAHVCVCGGGNLSPLPKFSEGKTCKIFQDLVTLSAFKLVYSQHLLYRFAYFMVECLCSRIRGITQHKPVAQMVGVHCQNKQIRMHIYHFVKKVVICAECSIVVWEISLILTQSDCTEIL